MNTYIVVDYAIYEFAYNHVIVWLPIKNKCDLSLSHSLQKFFIVFFNASFQ